MGRKNENMKFPVLKGKKTAFPRNAKCPQCEQSKVLEPHSMVILCGGAMLMDQKRKNGGPNECLDGFLELTWHGAHNGGTGKDRDIFTSVHLAEDCFGGQFEIYFCSTKCMRAFLNSWVDALETKIKKAKVSL
jgi:endogenous inhibitor of DNA gyrase (YacG/DUF329 family)